MLGAVLLEKQIDLVYGGASIGLMGTIAEHMLAGNGSVIGVIPKALAKQEVMHEGLSQLYIVESMHERKETMAELADGFIALPGGLGTLEELLEILTWAQLGMHNKPCALLNIDGYYDNLMLFLQQAVDEQFIHQDNLNRLIVDSNPVSLLERMISYRAPAVERIIDAGQT